ncbi:MAG: hypothetical protein ACREDO_07725 [Methyloceanibacter sp.]
MPMKLTLAAITSLLLTVPTVAQVPAATPHKLYAILCNTEDQAIDFASNMAAGNTEPIAIDLVNNTAGAEVCGRFIGHATVEIEKTENRNGGLYMLAGLRFVEDGRLGWTASWVAPFDATGLVRGT